LPVTSFLPEGAGTPQNETFQKMKMAAKAAVFTSDTLLYQQRILV
jgi:hypothetical protein